MNKLYRLLNRPDGVSGFSGISAFLGTRVSVMVLAFLLGSTSLSVGQWLISATNTNYTLDFDNTLSGVNNGAFAPPSNTPLASAPAYLRQVGTTVTAFTPAAHGLVDGNQIVVTGSSVAAYTGTFTISNVVATPTSVGTTSALSRTGTTVTATLNSHGLAINDIITVSGASPTVFNGTFRVTGVTTNTFTYTTCTSGPSTGTTQGTVVRSASFEYTALSAPGVDATGCTGALVGTFQRAAAIVGRSTPNAGELDSDAIQFLNTGVANPGTIAGPTFGGLALNTNSTNGGSPAAGVVVNSGYFDFNNIGSVGGAASPNRALGFQPTGSFFGSAAGSGGSIAFRLQNTTGSTLTELSISYKVYVYNDQGRSTRVGLSSSADNTTYALVAGTPYDSPATADGSPAWVMNFRTARITGLSVANNAFYYFKIYVQDVSGTGSRDEFAIDDIVVAATSAAPSMSVNQAGALVSGGSRDFGSTTIGANSDLTFTVNNSGGVGYLSQPIFSGTNASEFSVVGGLGSWPSQVTGGQTFTLRFSPSGAGGRSAQVSFNNSDGTGIANPFVINLTGTGTSALPTANLSISTGSQAEASSPTSVTLTVNTSAPVASDVTLPVAVSGTPLTASRYSFATPSITILSGNSTGSTTVDVVNDDIREGSETATFTISGGTGVVSLGTVSQNLIITDPIDDVQPIAALNTNYSQNFNTLAITGTSQKNLPKAVYIGGSASPTLYNTDNGTASSSAILSLGAISGPNRSLGAVNSGGSTTRWGVRYVNNTGSAISSLKVTYTGKQWRDNNTTPQTANFEYQVGASVTNINAGTWTGVSNLNFTSPSNAASPVIIDGDAGSNQTAFTNITFPVSIPAGQEIMIRWNFPPPGAGSSHTLAVDDLVVSASSETPGTVTSPTSTLIGLTSATLGGNVTSVGTGTFISRGVVWGLSPNPSTNVVTTSGTTGVFVVPVGGLPSGTLIYYRAFVNTSAGIVYTADATFTTLAPSVQRVWNNAAGGSWTTPGNWTPTGIPVAGDGVTFGAVGTYTVSDVPTINLSDFSVSTGANVTLTATAGRTINLTNGDFYEFFIATGGSLSIAGANAIVVQLPANGTGRVLGSLSMAGAAHRLLANITGVPNTNLIEFANGSSFTQGASFSGSPFGNVLANHNLSVVFRNGSTLTHQDGANPFGIGSPNSAITLEPNSNYVYTGTAAPALQGRTFGNFVINSPTLNLTATGANVWTLNNLTITAATTVNLNFTGGISLSGGITNNSATTLNFAPASSSTVTFSGTGQVTLAGTGDIVFGANAPVSLGAGKTINLARSVTFGGGITNNGVLSLAGNDATISGPIGGSGLINGNASSSLTIGAGSTSSISLGAGAFSTLLNLTSNRGVGNTINIPSPFSIIGTLTLSSGNLTCSSVRLVSNASGTARVATVPAASTLTGTFTVERHIPNNGWHLTGTALPSQTIVDWNDDLATAGPMPGVEVPNAGTQTSTIFEFDQNYTVNDGFGEINGWKVPVTSAISNTKGYRVFAPAGAILDNTGSFTSGAKSFTLAQGGPSYSGYNLLVNPHLSPVDPTLFTYGAGIQNTVVVWHPTLEQYQYVGSAIGSAVENTGINPLVMGQGFFAYTTTNGATLTINEDDKATGGTFFRQAASQPGMEIVLQNYLGKKDVARFQFLPQAQVGYEEKLDAYKFQNPGLNVYTLTSNGNRLAINGMPFTGSEVVVPIGFTAGSGSHKLSLVGLEVLNAAEHVYLKDNYTGQLVDMNQNSTYAFTMTSEATVNDRFELVFTTQSLTSTSDVLESSLSATVYPNPVNADRFNVALANFSGAVEIEVSDVLGRIVDSRRVDNASQSLEVQINAPAQSGQYILKVRSAKGSVVRPFVVR